MGVELMERCWNRSDTTSLESQVREYIYENGRSRSNHLLAGGLVLTMKSRTSLSHQLVSAAE